jgi:hypothetical protein
MFDAQLRRTDLTWGLRDLGVVVSVADQNRLALVEVIEMPANNLSVIFHRT